MKNLLLALTVSLFASFTPACVATSAEDAEVEPDQETTEESSQELVVCPGSGTCERAYRYCQDPRSTPSWCEILTRCLECGYEP
jgi:hypothetical protein